MPLKGNTVTSNARNLWDSIQESRDAGLLAYGTLADVPLHPLQKRQDRVCARQPLGRRSADQAVGGNAEGACHPLKGAHGILICGIVPDIDDADPLQPVHAKHGSKDVDGCSTLAKGKQKNRLVQCLRQSYERQKQTSC